MERWGAVDDVKVDPALRNFPYSGTEQCRMSFVVSCSHEIEYLEKVAVSHSEDHCNC